MEKEEVYKAIDSELNFIQEKEKVEESHIVEDFPLSSAIIAIEYNLKLAKNFWYTSKDPYPESMEFIRKISAICVKMGEKYNMPKRNN